MYLTKADLAEQLKAYQTTGQFSDSLHSMLTNLFQGVLRRYAKQCLESHDDLTQQCFLWFFENAYRLDPQGEAFAYITMSVLNLVRQHKRDLIRFEWSDISLNQLRESGFDVTDNRPISLFSFTECEPKQPKQPKQPQPEKLPPIVRYNNLQIFFNQSNSRKQRRYKHDVTINGETKPLKQWCREYGKPYPTILNRIKRAGMTPIEALLTDKVRRKKVGTTPNVSAKGQHTPGNNPSPTNPFLEFLLQSMLDPIPPLGQKLVPPDWSKIGLDLLQDQEEKRRGGQAIGCLLPCALLRLDISIHSIGLTIPGVSAQPLLPNVSAMFPLGFFPLPCLSVPPMNCDDP